jgi:hypothetical protein
VVVATPLASVRDVLGLILSLFDGLELNDQWTGWPSMGLPLTSRAVAWNVTGVPHGTGPVGPLIVRVTTTWPAYPKAVALMMSARAAPATTASRRLRRFTLVGPRWSVLAWFPSLGMFDSPAPGT